LALEMPPNFVNKLYVSRQHHMGVHNTHQIVNNTATNGHHMPSPIAWDPYLAACTTVPLLPIHLPVHPPRNATTTGRQRSIEAASLDSIPCGTHFNMPERAEIRSYRLYSFIPYIPALGQPHKM
jgi:hypothetical protein